MPAPAPNPATPESEAAEPAYDDTPVDTPVDDLDSALAVFLAERSRLSRIAHRILGDGTAAEDVVQEVWLRWQFAHRPKARNPVAYLTTVTTRVALTALRSARHRHETPAEPELVDLGDGSAVDPLLRVEQLGAIEDALALLMSRLTPDRLALYVLRKGFGYTYAELARLLRISVPNARVQVHRAQARLTRPRARPVCPESHRHLVTAFRSAAATGDLEDLTRVLALRPAAAASLLTDAAA